jgi:hypothetical protein
VKGGKDHPLWIFIGKKKISFIDCNAELAAKTIGFWFQIESFWN